MKYEEKAYEFKNQYLGLGWGKGAVVYEPVEPDERIHTAILVMHSDGDYYGFIPCPELAKRGFYVMAANVGESKSPLDKKIQDVGFYVDYLKKLPRIERVILLGHSGGATLMSCYQAVAENGVQVFQDEGRIVKMQDMDPLTPAEGVMFMDSNFGNGVMNILSVDPMITDETSTKNLNSEFDLFDPANGYSPDGAHYSKEFALKYNQAQEERFNRIRERVLERYAALERGEGDYEDDEPFIIPGGSQLAPNNRLFPQDISYLNHTQGEYPLLHGDGTITTEVVYTRRPQKFDHSFTRLYGWAAEATTVRTYATSSTLRSNGYHVTETAVEGIDWDSNYCCTPGNVKHISAPMLIMGMTGGYEFLASEIVYKNAQKTNDKTIAFVEGATHNFTVEKATEEYPGQYGDTVKTTFDFVAKWIVEKYL